MTFIKQFSIISIIIIILSFYSNIVLSQDEKYYFKGTFGTSTLTVGKTNSISGTTDVLITRSDGSYKFNYNISMNNIDGTDIFSTRIMGPSAPNKDGGSLKLTLSYSTDSKTTSKFVASGSQTVAFNSPSYSLIAPILMGLTTNPEKSNYVNEQFYMVVNTVSGGTSPVSRAQLIYTGSSNLPNAGGGVNPNGSDDNLPTTTPLPNSSDPSDLNKTSSDASPSSSTNNESGINENGSTETPSASTSPSPSSSSEKTGNGNLNPGGVETSTSNPSSSTTTTTSSKDTDSSTGSSILPTILIVSLFVLTLVAMS